MTSSPKMIQVITQPPSGWVRCPYLGLHDDSSTSLAYPSDWNYCYHANPAAPIRVSHQADVCLCPEYIHCPVNVSNTWGRLPRPLRGKAAASLEADEFAGTRHRTLLLALLVLLLTLLVFEPGFLF
jgi:hypothetical protein